MTSEPKFSPTLHASTAQRVATWARHSQAREVVRMAAAALGATAQVMPLKGVLLGAIGVVPPAERPIRDADVLVRGATLTEVARRLGKAGFTITDFPWSHGYVSFAHRDHEQLWLDVHTVLMPAGLGRLRPDYMFRHARPDDVAFRTRVYLPEPRALMIQLLANIVKDRIVRAFEHVPADVAAVARKLSPEERGAVAADARALALHRGMAQALTWVAARVDEPAVPALLQVLVPSPSERAEVARQVAQLGRADQGSLRARLRARAGADLGWLQIYASAFTAASVVTYPLRKAWLVANNRGDGSGLMR
jgi:hypothetical protein